MQPLTFWYEYTVNPGKEAQFLELVKTVGAPVRDKLMADGVVLAWGVHSGFLRAPGNSTHTILVFGCGLVWNREGGRRITGTDCQAG